MVELCSFMIDAALGLRFVGMEELSSMEMIYGVECTMGWILAKMAVNKSMKFLYYLLMIYSAILLVLNFCFFMQS